MKEKIDNILSRIDEVKIKTKEELEQFRIAFLGSKGEIKQLFNEFKDLSKEEKKEFGQVLNMLKQKAQNKFQELQHNIESTDSSSDNSSHFDFSKPVDTKNIGSSHPISIVRKEIIDIFSRIGFGVEEGPEIEDDRHNFTALNFPPEHPARDMQDTFFVEKNPDIALRTHTSSVQIRTMENNKPPIRILAPGRVYRNEAISARSHCFFHQIEGLYIDEDVNFADLKQVLLYFAQQMFGSETTIRMRPSYFPFTEPSAEVDVSCNICGGEGCNVCKYTGFLEILGCGMVDPNVLENCGINSKKYSGYAFGMGIDRIAMLKYNIKDLRIFSENDIRFLSQFQSL